MKYKIFMPTETNRFIRLRDAPNYLGMNKNYFNEKVRPYLIEIPIGKQGIAFDRLDLDEWAEQYKLCNGRLGDSKRRKTWDAKDLQVSTDVETPGISINKSAVSEFQKALELTCLKKQKSV